MSTMKRPDEEVIDLEEARSELAEAQRDYEAKKEALEYARRQETSTKNRLNNAQKRFDKAVEQIKTNAPSGTDWHVSRNSRAESAG